MPLSSFDINHHLRSYRSSLIVRDFCILSFQNVSLEGFYFLTSSSSMIEKGSSRCFSPGAFVMAVEKVHWIFLFRAKIAPAILIPSLQKSSLLYYDSKVELLASTYTHNSMNTTLSKLNKCLKHDEHSISRFRMFCELNASWVVFYAAL